MHSNRRSILTLGAALPLVAGCNTLSAGRTSLQPPTVSFESLVRQLKYDLGTHMWRHRNDELVVTAEQDEVIRENAKNNPEVEHDQRMAARRRRIVDPTTPCNGQVNLDVNKIEITITTISSHASSASGGLEVPIGFIDVGVNGSRFTSVSNSQATTLNIFPREEQEILVEPTPVEGWTGTPLADTLDLIRSDLVKTSDTAPCFNFGENLEKQNNSIKWAFGIEKTQGAGGTLKLIVFSLGAESKFARSVANTIEVWFIDPFGDFG